MTRLFGFLIAVAGLASQANAALLVKYDFTGASAVLRVVPTSVSAGVVASDFSGAGNANTPGYWTGSTNLSTTDNSQGGFSLSADTASGFEITRVVFRFRASGMTSANRTQTATLTMSTGDNLVGSQSVTSTSNPFVIATLDTDPVLVYSPIGELGPLGFNFTSKFNSTASNNAKFQLDYVEVYGELVPEPASMAVFGLLVAPVAFRRLRRKS